MVTWKDGALITLMLLYLIRSDKYDLIIVLLQNLTKIGIFLSLILNLNPCAPRVTHLDM